MKAGTIVGILNPKAMKPTVEHGFSYCIDLEAQIFVIGYSEDYSICKFTSSIDNRQCQTFVNKSAEIICETHKLVQQ
jgi:hypothetical protein